LKLFRRFPTPSPPAEKATASQDQAGKSSAGDGARNSKQAQIKFGFEHLAGRGKMLIVRPEARLFRVSASEVCIEGIGIA
jgi:hypothetical protein